MQPPMSLDWYLGYIHCMVSSPDVPQWEGVRITERVEYGGGGRILSIAPLQEVDDFRPRFADLVTRGWPWLNLHALGILDDHLIVALELPAYEPTGVESTSVNLSGFSSLVVAHGCQVEPLLEGGAPSS